MGRRRVRQGGQVVAGAIVLSLVAGAVLGQPVLLAYVETGSMEPTIEAGDGFVAVPSAIAGDPEPGSVVVFEAEEIDGGGLTTHRIVDETEHGYVTHGDANPFTDQDAGEPPVQEGQIVAVAWQPGDTVVTIPHLGSAIMGAGTALERSQQWLADGGVDVSFDLTTVAYALLALSGVLYVYETRREATDRTVTRRDGRESQEGTLSTARAISAGCALVVVVAAAGTMIGPAGPYSFGVVSAETGSERPLVIERGTTSEVDYGVPNDGLVPVVTYVEPASDRVAVDDEQVRVGPRSEATVDVAISAPSETGYYPTYVAEYRYLHVLPAGVIDRLYRTHPWLPTATILALLGGTVYLFGRLLLGRDPPRARRYGRRTDRMRRSNRRGAG